MPANEFTLGDPKGAHIKFKAVPYRDGSRVTANAGNGDPDFSLTQKGTDAEIDYPDAADKGKAQGFIDALAAKYGKDPAADTQEAKTILSLAANGKPRKNNVDTMYDIATFMKDFSSTRATTTPAAAPPPAAPPPPATTAPAPSPPPASSAPPPAPVPAAPPPPAATSFPEQTTHDGFEFGSAALSDKQKEEWKAFAEQYKANGNNQHVLLVGYTDAKGSAKVNVEKGNDRAKAVQEYLAGLDVKADIESGGKGHIIDPKDDAKNRRVTAYVGEDIIAAARMENQEQAAAAALEGKTPAHHPAAHRRNHAPRNGQMAPQSGAADPAALHEQSAGVLNGIDNGQYANGYSVSTGANNQSVSVTKSSGGGYSFASMDADGKPTGVAVHNVSQDVAHTYLDHLHEDPAAFQSTMPTMQKIAEHNSQQTGTAKPASTTIRGYDGGTPIKATPLITP